MAYLDVVLDANPTCYWRLGESSGTVAKDEMGVADAAYLGSPVLGASALINDPNPSVQFSGSLGTSEYLRVADSDVVSLGPGDFTIEEWVYFDSVGQGNSLHYLFAKGVGEPLLVISGPTLGSPCQILLARCATAGGGVTNGGNTFSAPGVALPDRPNHIVGTYTDLKLAIYLNGVKVAQSQYSPTAPPFTKSTTDLSIGAFLPTAFGNRMKGRFDEIAIYDHALSPETVREHYLAGVSTILAPVVARKRYYLTRRGRRVIA